MTTLDIDWVRVEPKKARRGTSVVAKIRMSNRADMIRNVAYGFDVVDVDGVHWNCWTGHIVRAFTEASDIDKEAIAGWHSFTHEIPFIIPDDMPLGECKVVANTYIIDIFHPEPWAEEPCHYEDTTGLLSGLLEIVEEDEPIPSELLVTTEPNATVHIANRYEELYVKKWQEIISGVADSYGNFAVDAETLVARRVIPEQEDYHYRVYASNEKYSNIKGFRVVGRTVVPSEINLPLTMSEPPVEEPTAPGVDWVILIQMLPNLLMMVTVLYGLKVVSDLFVRRRE